MLVFLNFYPGLPLSAFIQHVPVLSQTTSSVQILWFNISLFSVKTSMIGKSTAADLAVLQPSDVHDKNLLNCVLI